MQQRTFAFTSFIFIHKNNLLLQTKKREITFTNEEETSRAIYQLSQKFLSSSFTNITSLKKKKDASIKEEKILASFFCHSIHWYFLHFLEM